MVAIRAEDGLPKSAVDFLRHCYRFVNEAWQHTDRDDSPDQGFERAFMASCVGLGGWEISHEREMRLGQGLSTASGVLHEIDIVATRPEVNSILELKNRREAPGKNDIVVFFAKILDYLALNPGLLSREFCPIFMSTAIYEQKGLEACLGLGIHPAGPGLRPVPVLVDNAKRINVELRRGLQVSEEILDRFEDFCADLNNISLILTDTWFSSRFGQSSENTIVMRAVAEPDSETATHLLRQLNAECNWLLSSVREAMK